MRNGPLAPAGLVVKWEVFWACSEDTRDPSLARHVTCLLTSNPQFSHLGKERVKLSQPLSSSE